MSYDLNFWRYSPTHGSADGNGEKTIERHLDVYKRLCDGEVVTELENLPVEKIRARLREVMVPSWIAPEGIDDGNPSFWEKGSASVEILVTHQWVRFDFRGRWTGDDANLVVDVMVNEFRCPLFDPQVKPAGERFDSGMDG